MSNLSWYLCLAVIGAVSAFYAIYTKRHVYKVSTLLVFYIFAASFAWTGEFLVLGLFNSYAYKPGVFENIWAQNLLGHLILNSTLYPAAAIVMVAFSLGFGWILFVAAFLTSIEYLFVQLGLYEQHWWRYYMTVIIVIVILQIDRKLFEKIKKSCKGAARVFTFYFVAMLIIHLPAPILLLLGKQHYYIGIINNMMGDMYLSSIIIIFAYHLIEAFLSVLFTCILKKWYWKLLPFIISIGIQSICVRMGILVMTNGWKLGYTLVIYELFILAYILIEKYTLKPLPDKQ